MKKKILQILDITAKPSDFFNDDGGNLDRTRNSQNGQLYLGSPYNEHVLIIHIYLDSVGESLANVVGLICEDSALAKHVSFRVFHSAGFYLD